MQLAAPHQVPADDPWFLSGPQTFTLSALSKNKSLFAEHDSGA
jgi:hypothetical protein